MIQDRGSGLVWGLFFGVLFSLVALAAWLIGSDVAFAEIGTTPFRLVAAYVVGGAIGGLLFDVLEPMLKRWRFGGMLVGFLVSLPVTAGIAVGMDLRGGLLTQVVSVFLTSSILGGGLGHLLLRGR